MTNNRASVDKGGEKGRFLAALRGIGGRAYLTGGPVFGLVVIVLFATGFALSAIAISVSRAITRPSAEKAPVRLPSSDIENAIWCAGLITGDSWSRSFHP